MEMFGLSTKCDQQLFYKTEVVACQLDVVSALRLAGFTCSSYILQIRLSIHCKENKKNHQ